jgi:hypothetical protein
MRWNIEQGQKPLTWTSTMHKDMAPRVAGDGSPARSDGAPSAARASLWDPYAGYLAQNASRLIAR